MKYLFNYIDSKITKFWYIWCKAIGEKAKKNCDKTSDYVAIVRTILILGYLITNAFIIAGVIRHW